VGHGAGSAIRIAGHDDHPMARFTCPPLTTVSQDYETMAARAATILFSLIDGSAPDKERSTLRLEGKLIMRASA
jgi:DNA-binding LacI/PurR family transcriptional regulator